MDAGIEIPAHDDRDALIARLRDENDSLRSDLRRADLERQWLREQLDAYVRRMYAASSEKGSVKQADLFFNEAETLCPKGAAAAEPPAEVKVPAHTRAKKGRQPLSEDLPRVVVRHELPQDQRLCAHDGATLTEIGIEASEQLDIVPAVIRVIRHERVKYACPCCEHGVVTAPGPMRLIPRGLFTEAALAHIVVAKYQDALPLYRQAQMLRRCGGDIARHTLAANVIRVGEAVQPLINLLRERLLDAPLIHGDETELQVLKEDGRPAQAKSWLWLQMTDTGPPIRLFTYAPSRAGKTALGLYEGARGALLSDGHEAYAAAVVQAYQLKHLGCWAHARRRFIEAHEALPKAARTAETLSAQMLALITELYGIETQCREASAEERRERRQHDSRAVIARIEALLLAHLHGVTPQSALGKALHYLQHQWPKLIGFLEDAGWPLDNNAAENAIRPFVIGRKNWLFSDTVKGAQASANLYSLIETAKANGIEPYAYLCAVFTALPTATTVEDIERLLPWTVDITPPL